MLHLVEWNTGTTKLGFKLVAQTHPTNVGAKDKVGDKRVFKRDLIFERKTLVFSVKLLSMCRPHKVADAIRSSARSSADEYPSGSVVDVVWKTARLFKGRLAAGTAIEAKFKTSGVKWIRGVISKGGVGDEKFNIQYNDGRFEANVPKSRMREFSVENENLNGEEEEEILSFYRGGISSAAGDGAYNVYYDDGDEEVNVPIERIRFVHPSFPQSILFSEYYDLRFSLEDYSLSIVSQITGTTMVPTKMQYDAFSSCCKAPDCACAIDDSKMNGGCIILHRRLYYNVSRKRYFSPLDLVVGAQVFINALCFELTGSRTESDILVS